VFKTWQVANGSPICWVGRRFNKETELGNRYGTSNCELKPCTQQLIIKEAKNNDTTIRKHRRIHRRTKRIQNPTKWRRHNQPNNRTTKKNRMNETLLLKLIILTLTLILSIIITIIGYNLTIR